MKASPVLRNAGGKAGRDSAKWVRSLTEAMHACSAEVGRAFARRLLLASVLTPMVP